MTQSILPLGSKVLIGSIAVNVAMMMADRAVDEAKRVLVPLDVGGPSERLRALGFDQLIEVHIDRCERGNGGDRPVHEDPELGVLPPCWNPALSQAPKLLVVDRHRLTSLAGI